jgi:hypothetical protein
VNITLSGDHIPLGSYSFDVARVPGVFSVPYDVTFRINPTVDMASAGQATYRHDQFKVAGSYGPVINTSTAIYMEWDKVLHLERRIRVFGVVQFPIEPSCRTYVSYAVHTLHDGYMTDYRPLIGFTGVQGDWGERYASQMLCRRNPPAGFVDSIHFEEFQQCNWDLEPNPLDECIDVNGGVPAPPMLPLQTLKGIRPMGGGDFVWAECPVEDPKSKTFRIYENWVDGAVAFGVGGDFGPAAYRGIGIFVRATDYLGTCVVRQPYNSDDSFDLTVRAEFYD